MPEFAEKNTIISSEYLTSVYAHVNFCLFIYAEIVSLLCIFVQLIMSLQNDIYQKFKNV